MEVKDRVSFLVLKHFSTPVEFMPFIQFRKSKSL